MSKKEMGCINKQFWTYRNTSTIKGMQQANNRIEMEEQFNRQQKTSRLDSQRQEGSVHFKMRRKMSIILIFLGLISILPLLDRVERPGRYSQSR